MLIWHSSRHRKYLPVLKNFPTRYIHEPWNAPEAVQKAAKCIVGKEYSLPMVNHVVVSRINMERMKQVYQHLAKYRDPVTNMCVFIPLNAVGLRKEPSKRTVMPPFTPQGAIVTHRAYESDTVCLHTPPESKRQNSWCPNILSQTLISSLSLEMQRTTLQLKQLRSCELQFVHSSLV
uniref:(California timema) hypothetical protein n=1 Tax=Timema californicum TaxID=61474 RepID=A0A7R9J9B9_TIMCA|nr:unnamed protein product [Timema californicum]